MIKPSPPTLPTFPTYFTYRTYLTYLPTFQICLKHRTLCFQQYAELSTRIKYLARTSLTLNMFLLEAWKYPTVLYCIILLFSLITFLRTCRGNKAALYICIQSTHDILPQRKLTSSNPRNSYSFKVVARIPNYT